MNTTNYVEKLMRDKKYLEAKNVALDFLEKYPDNKNITVSLCRAYIFLCKYDEAKKITNSLLLKDVNDNIAYFYQAIINKYENEFDLANKNFKLALINGFNSNSIWKNLSRLAELQNKDEEAIYYLNMIAENYPDDIYSRLRLVSLYQKNLLFIKALPVLDEIIFIEPSMQWAYEVKARILFAIGMQDESITFAKKSLEIFPENIELHNVLIKNDIYKGNYESADALIEKYIAVSENLRLNILKGESLIAQNEPGKAMDFFDYVFNNDDGILKLEAGFYMVLIALEKREYKLALNYAEEIIKTQLISPYYFMALYYKPSIMKLLGKSNYKEEYCSLIDKLESEFQDQRPYIMLYLAMSYIEIGKIDSAKQIIEEAEFLNGDDGEVSFMRYIVAMKENDSENIDRYKADAISKYPNAENIFVLLEE